MNLEYRHALGQAECDGDVRVIIVTGAGRIFCVGAYHTRVFLAEEALNFGLVNAVLPPDELMLYVEKFMCDMISTVSPGSLRETKRQIYIDLHRDVVSAVNASRAHIERMVKDLDFAEGVALSSKSARRVGESHENQIVTTTVKE